MSQALLEAPRELTIPTVMGGVSEDTYQQGSYWNSRAFFWFDIPGDRAQIEIPRLPYLPLASVDLWCSLGSEIINYDVWHRLSNPELICPYSVNQDENWHQWGLSSNGGHAPIEISGIWYRSNLYGDAGARLPASQWYGYIANPDSLVTGIDAIITVEEFLAIPRPAP